jgi:hypothetical protein
MLQDRQRQWNKKMGSRNRERRWKEGIFKKGFWEENG